MHLRHWFILFLSTALITTACKTRQNNHSLTNGNKNNPKTDTTNTDTQTDSSGITKLVPDSLILRDSSLLTLNGDTDTVVRKKSFLEDKVDYQSEDSIVFDVKNKIMYLHDTAQINYQDIQLVANYIEIDLNKKELFGRGTKDSTGKESGRPEFKQKDQSFTAREIGYNFESQRGLIKEAFTSQGEIYLHADVAKKDSNNTVYVKNAKFTTCTDPDHPHFYIQTTRGKIVQDKTVVTGPAIFKIADVPTPLMLPFGYFPNQKNKSSGLLLPQYGENNFGFFLKGLGYYFAINDKMDLSISGDIYTSLSFGVRADFNYAKRYKFSGNIFAGFSQLQTGDPEVPSEFNVNRDFIFKWTHQQDAKANPTTSFRAIVDIGSRSFNNLNSTSVTGIVKNTLASNIQFSKSFRNTPISLNISARHSQNLTTGELVIVLPDLVLNVVGFNPFKRKKQVGVPKWYENISLTYSMSISNQLRTYDSLLVEDPVRELLRMNNGIMQTLNLNTNLKLFKYITVTPSINYIEKWHFANLTKNFNPSTMLVEDDTLRGFFSTRQLNASVSMTTIVYGMYQFKGKKIKALRHIITPSLTANFRPDLGDQIQGYFGPGGQFISYSPNQIGIFNQSPSGMSGTVGFSIVNRLELKVASKKDTITGTKKIPLLENLSLGMNYDFARDSLNLSPLSITGFTTILNLFQLNFGLAFDPYSYNYNSSGIAQKVNRLSWQDGQGLMRFTTASFALNFTFKGKSKRDKSATNGLNEAESMVANNPAAYDYVDFNIPYNFKVGYNIIYNKPLDMETITHAINFAGDFSITPKWKIGFEINYDIQNNRIGTSSISLYRDLHCWDMSVQIIPFGTRQSYMFTLKVKSGLLQMLKLQRQAGNSGTFF